MTRWGPPNERLQSLSAYFLALTMAAGVLVMFILRLWINPTLFQTGLFLLGAVWAIAFVIRPFRLRFSPVLIPLAATVGWGLWQLYAGYTRERWDTWVAVLAWLGNLLAFFLAMQVCGSSRVRRRFLSTLLYFAFVLSVVSVVQYFSSDGKVFWFYPTYQAAVLGPFLNRDQYAAFIEMVLPLALVQTFRGGRQSLRFAVVAAAMFASVIAGASRAGALLTTAEIVVIPAIFWAKGNFGREKLRSATINVGLAAFVFVAVVGWAVVWSRFQDPDPLKGRREMLADTISMIRAKPYFGFGMGTFQTAYPAYGSVDFGAIVNHAHNDWAEWAADGGIPFSLLMVSIAIWSLPKAFTTIWGIGLIVVFLHSFVDFALQKPVLDLWLFVLLGALAAETERRSAAATPDSSF
jgi:O-antigen ligase